MMMKVMIDGKFDIFDVDQYSAELSFIDQESLIELKITYLSL